MAGLDNLSMTGDSLQAIVIYRQLCKAAAMQITWILGPKHYYTMAFRYHVTVYIRPILALLECNMGFFMIALSG